LEGSEVVGNEECFVISGSSSSSKKETLWVSKLNYLIKKSAYFLESYQGEESKIEITDEQIEEVAKSMGLSNAQEARQKIREDIEKAKASSTTGETKGTCVELYGDIFFPDLNEGDFQFKLPNAVALKDSLFGGMLGK
jgi:isopropylmalate/homocitrate/citramalate synthase